MRKSRVRGCAGGVWYDVVFTCGKVVGDVDVDMCVCHASCDPSLSTIWQARLRFAPSSTSMRGDLRQSRPSQLCTSFVRCFHTSRRRRQRRVVKVQAEKDVLAHAVINLAAKASSCVTRHSRPQYLLDRCLPLRHRANAPHSDAGWPCRWSVLAGSIEADAGNFEIWILLHDQAWPA